MIPLQELLDAHPLPDGSGGKDESGTVLIVAPSACCPGAGLLAARAALRCGSGRVQLVVHPTVAPAVASSLPEAFVIGWDSSERLADAVKERAERADVVVVGPGSDRVRRKVVKRLGEHAGILLLDAGALPHAARLQHPRLVLAPNVTEARSLVSARQAAGQPSVTDALDLIDLAATLAQDLGCEVAVRDRQTVVSDGRTGWCFDDAPPGLGTPGSGDVLMGVLAALLATGVPVLGSLAWSVQLHADAGMVQPAVGYLASDLVEALPTVLARHRPT